MKRQRSYKLNGKYTYVEVPTNRERFYTWVALIGTIGFTYGNMVSPKLWSVMEARASEPVAVEQVLSVPTESLDTSEGVVSSYDAEQSPAPSEVSTVETREEIESYILKVFGDDGRLAIAVGMSESHLIPSKTLIARSGKHSWSTATYKGECSIGLFMINLASDSCNGKLVHYSRIPGNNLDEKIAWLKVPKNNIDFAKKLYDERGGNFTAWSGYTGGGYKKHIKE
jgi:hypothetical protein